MPSLSPAELCTYLQRDLPGVLAPKRQPSTPNDQGAISNRNEEEGRNSIFQTQDPIIIADRFVDTVLYLRNKLGYTYLSDISVVDYLADGIFEVVYRFYHLEGGTGVVLKVRVSRDQPHIPSITPIWPGADFQEREGFDLYGIIFVGHPYLKRIYMWDEFEGYPMRKDFPKQGDKYIGEDDA